MTLSGRPVPRHTFTLSSNAFSIDGINILANKKCCPFLHLYILFDSTSAAGPSLRRSRRNRHLEFNVQINIINQIRFLLSFCSSHFALPSILRPRIVHRSPGVGVCFISNSNVGWDRKTRGRQEQQQNEKDSVAQVNFRKWIVGGGKETTMTAAGCGE